MHARARSEGGVPMGKAGSRMPGEGGERGPAFSLKKRKDCKATNQNSADGKKAGRTAKRDLRGSGIGRLRCKDNQES